MADFCDHCPYRGRFAKPFGREDAEIVLVGEAPGREEFLQGEVFVGRSGQLLRQLLEKYGLLDSVYITNAVACWPGPGNPTPPMEVILGCRERLVKEIKAFERKVIVPLGSVALYAVLLKKVGGILSQRGKLFESEEFAPARILPMVHPAYVLRSGQLQLLENDIKLLKLLVEAGFDLDAPTLLRDVQTLNDALELLEALEAAPVFAFDTETTSTSFYDAEILCISFSVKEGEGWYLPLWQEGEFFYWSAGEWEEIFPRLKRVFEDPKKLKVAHNAKFDKEILIKTLGIEVKPPIFDTMLAHHLVDENCPHDLETTVAVRNPAFMGYKEKLRTIFRGLPGKQEEKHYGHLPLDVLKPYAASDADATLQAYGYLKEKLEEEGLEELFWRITMPLAEVLTRMELRGVAVDVERMNSLSEQLQRRLEEIEGEVYKIAFEAFKGRLDAYLESLKTAGLEGEEFSPERLEGAIGKAFASKVSPRLEEALAGGPSPELFDEVKQQILSDFSFNLRSTKQLGDLLFVWLGLKAVEKTPSGAPSTSESSLRALQGQHPVIDLILEHRDVHKLFSTYVKGLRKRAVKEDGSLVLHCDYLIHGTVTGRLASRNPNLQNIPRNSDIRSIFKPRPGYKFVSADFSQAELRAWAVASGDPDLKRIFEEDKDIHSEITREIFGVSKEDVDPAEFKELRAQTKMVVFGLIYGRGPRSIAQQLGCSISRAQNLINRLFERFPVAARWRKEVMNKAVRDGFLVLPTGRKHRFPEAVSGADEVIASIQRRAVNFPCQGLAAELTNDSLIQIHRRLLIEGLCPASLEEFVRGEVLAYPLLQIHDQIIVEAREDVVERVEQIVREEMQRPREFFPIKLKVDIDVLDAWR